MIGFRCLDLKHVALLNTKVDGHETNNDLEWSSLEGTYYSRKKTIFKKLMCGT